MEYILSKSINNHFRDITDRYDRLSKIFIEENSDIKKAEQSLYLIENTSKTLQVIL